MDVCKRKEGKRNLDFEDTFYLLSHTPRTSRSRRERRKWGRVLARHFGPVTRFKISIQWCQPVMQCHNQLKKAQAETSA